MREPIPEELNRQVRQRCGFCCVICGSPIYDYDHIEDYSNVNEHTFENLVLLCPTCHRKKTNGLITKEAVIEAKEKANSKERTAKDVIYPQFYTLNSGTTIIQSFDGAIFDILGFGCIIIKYRDRPLINAVLFDPDGEKAIEIIENQYTLCTRIWDINYVGNTLTFRNGARRIFASLTFDVEENMIILKGNIELLNGIRIKITNTGIYADKHLLARDNQISKCKVGMIITDRPVKHAFLLSGTAVNSWIKGVDGIAFLNPIACHGNILEYCNIAILWEIKNLVNLK